MASETPEPDPLKGGAVIGAIAGEDVRNATETEHKMTLLESFRLYPAAAGWSLFFSMGVIMYANMMIIALAVVADQGQDRI